MKWGGGEWKLGARTEFAKFLTYLLPFDDKSHCTCVTKCDNKAFHLSLAGAAACVPILVAGTSFILRPNFMVLPLHVPGSFPVIQRRVLS